jgi:hypothetical protein
MSNSLEFQEGMVASCVIYQGKNKIEADAAMRFLEASKNAENTIPVRGSSLSMIIMEFKLTVIESQNPDEKDDYKVTLLGKMIKK